MVIGFSSNPNQQQHTVDEAAASNQVMNRAEPPIIEAMSASIRMDELPVEILFNIFEFMSWNDLQAILLTSTRLNATAIAYVQHRFKTNQIHVRVINENQYFVSPPTHRDMSLILSYIRNVTLHGGNLQILESIPPPENVRKITFKHLLPRSNSSEIIVGALLLNTLENVEEIAFWVKQFNGRNYDRMLQRCQNIKCLTIMTNSSKVRRFGYRNSWHLGNYPQLQTIHWNLGYTSQQNELRVLLRQNPGLVNHKISRNIHTAIEFIENSQLVMNKLALEFQRTKDAQDFPLIYDTINNLHENEQYQKLYLTFGTAGILNDNMDHIATLRSLHSISYDGEYISSLERLSGLKELHITSIQNGMEAAKQLPHLKVLAIKEASLYNIRPFIQHCPNLGKIVVQKVLRSTIISIDNLISDRQNLPNATTIKLYLDEWLYLRLKKYSQVPKLIEIRRFESFQPDILSTQSQTHTAILEA